MTAAPPIAVSLAEAIKLGAVDSQFYSRYFFPRTVRQDSSEFDRQVWDMLDSASNRYVALKIFRGGAKTIRLRLFASKRIAYGISRTIVYTSNTEAHAARSLRWLKRQVKYNSIWAQAFDLRQGSKWTDVEMEIIHGVEEIPIYIVAVGITGQVRGLVTEDDFRPDLIIADDLDNEETTGTPEQRKKTQALFFGALGKSLAPPTDSPHAKMALLQTPLAPGDTIDLCAKDPSWACAEFSCFNTRGESSWPARFPTEFLLAEKAAHVHRNQTSLWMREMECKIVSDEAASFRLAWLKEFDVLPQDCWYSVAIDPASSDKPDADYFAMVLHAHRGRDWFLEKYFLARAVDPDMAVNALFEMIMWKRPRYIAVETIAYQRILAWYLKKVMQRLRIYIPVKEVQDRRKKSDRIIQSISDLAANGNYHWRGAKAQPEFGEAFQTYGPLYLGHDDLLDAVAIDITASHSPLAGDELEGEYVRLEEEESAAPRLNWKRPAP